MNLASSDPILNAAQMRECDSYTIHQLSVPSRRLMETAARAFVACLTEKTDWPRRVLFLCGGGNNGGDGFAAARFLAGEHGVDGWSSRICYLGACTDTGEPDVSRMSEECAVQYRLAAEAGIPIGNADRFGEFFDGTETVADAVFGIGLSRPVTGTTARIFRTVQTSGCPVAAVDIPSGLSADTGHILGTALRARLTVTMQCLKAGLLLFPGAEICGEIHVADIGVSRSPGLVPYAHLTGSDLVKAALPPRRRQSHKGTYGKLCLVCGSKGMSGAALMAARAALRSGAGLVRILTPEENRPILQTALPEAIVDAYDSQNPDRSFIEACLSEADGFVIGCGLGQSDTSRELLRTVLNGIPANPTTPVVLDADALNLLSRDETLYETRLLDHPVNPIVLTPHVAEMSRLSGLSVSEVTDSLPEVSTRFAARHGVTVVLKDAHTVIASPDGYRFINVSGNAGMAVGGNGDVLAGMIGSLLVQGRLSLSGPNRHTAVVASAAVFLHGKAGNAAADDLGETGLLPTDLIGHIPAVLGDLSDTRTVILHRNAGDGLTRTNG